MSCIRRVPVPGFFRVLVAGVLCFAPFVFGQNVPATQPPVAASPAPPSVPVEMPKEPLALLNLARDRNGIDPASTNPWHLKASFEVLDDQGAVKEKGTFEEFHFAPNRYKTITSSPSFSQTEFVNDTGRFIVGDHERTKLPADLVKETLLVVLPSEGEIHGMELSLAERDFGGNLLQCISIASIFTYQRERSRSAQAPPSAIPMEAECFAAKAPVLRIRTTESGYYEMLYDQIGTFRGRYVALDSQVRRLSKPLLHMHIDTLETLKDPDEAMLTAPPDAISPPKRIKVSGGEMAGNIMKKTTPKYPSAAASRRIQGVVVLHAIIDRDGKVALLEPIAGPPELVPPAMEAVRQWEYKPYLLNGEPIEVETTINVVYQLGG